MSERPLSFHLDRLNAWLVELWKVKSIDLHMCDGTRRDDQSGLLQNIREDVAALRHDHTTLGVGRASAEVAVEHANYLSERLEFSESARADLYEALAEIMADIEDDGSPSYKKQRAALAKAEGK
jgi:hypothetical protein